MSGWGLTVRWSLVGAPDGAADALREYVTGTSVGRFTGREGLVQKTWQLADGSFFAGSYVFSSESARAAFVAALRESPSPVDGMLARTPESVEEFEVVAHAVGADGPLQ